MPFSKKHTGDFQGTFKSFIYTKSLRGLLCAVVFLFTLPQGFASGQETGKVYTNGDATIVYSASNSGDVVITPGKITAAEGQTIRLLPGTRIKSGGQLTINISDKECQDAVAREVALEKEEKMFAFAEKRRKEAFLFTTPKEISLLFSAQSSLPNSTISQQRLELTASLVITTPSVTAPVTLLNKKITLTSIYKLPVSSSLSYYTPVYSWGERGETVKVMLC